MCMSVGEGGGVHTNQDGNTKRARTHTHPLRFSYGKLGREANVQGEGEGGAASSVVGQEEKRDPRDFVLWSVGRTGWVWVWEWVWAVSKPLAFHLHALIARPPPFPFSFSDSAGSPPRLGSPRGPPPGARGGRGGTSSAPP